VWRALVVRQPWATLIARREKTIEVRAWSTSYRGPLLIVSAQRPAVAPAGYVVCRVTLVDVRPMTRSDEAAAMCRVGRGQYAWVLADAQPCVPPVRVRGRLGLFTVYL
jgi:hypothetical protein